MTAAKIRSGILESFQSTGIFAMASPGESSTHPKPNDTCSEYWNKKFKDSVVEFVTLILSDSEILR